MSRLSDSVDYSFKFTLRRITVVPAVGLLAFCLLLLGMIGYLIATMSWLDHANRVIAAAQSAENALLDVQTSVRGYVLSGDPMLLEPYRTARPAAGPALANLEEMVKDDPQQSEIAKQLDRDAATWLAWVDGKLQHFIDTKETPKPETLREGMVTFNPVRDEAAAFLGNEYGLRDTRSAQARRVTIGTVAGIVVVLAGLGTWQALFIRKGLRETTDRFRQAVDLAERRNEHIKVVVRELDSELKAVAEIQRSLLPLQLPQIPLLRLAASYQTSKRAGGDYYDFFRLTADESVPADQAKWGVLIADVSGHGTPAAVLMAVTHAIAHGIERPLDKPSRLLRFVNDRLCDGYTTENAAFVTAFFGIYDPASRTLEYSSAGHNPPRFQRKNESIFHALDDAQGLPLGVQAGWEYPDASIRIDVGDTLILYTDGWVEARDANDELFTVERLEETFKEVSHLPPTDMIAHALETLKNYVGDRPPQDDCTLLVLQMSDHDTDAQPAHTIVSADTSLMQEMDAVLSSEPPMEATHAV